MKSSDSSFCSLERYFEFMNDSGVLMQSWRKSPEWRRASSLAKRLSDGYCYLCGGQLDFTIRERSHPFKVEVDHVLPASRGGALFDQGNLACVHNRCNKVKGSKLVGQGVLNNVE